MIVKTVLIKKSLNKNTSWLTGIVVHDSMLNSEKNSALFDRVLIILAN